MAEKRSECKDFARLLAEAGVPEEKEMPDIPCQNLETFPIRATDDLNLSVQGKKALSSASRSREKETLSRDEMEKSVDFQGNRINISSTAKKFSRQLENNIAWETRKERCKKEPGHD